MDNIRFIAKVVSNKRPPWVGYDKPLEQNVLEVRNAPSPDPTIKDMQPGSSGYTLPWAYDQDSKHLNVDYPISKTPGGTCTMLVICVEVGKYILDMGNEVE